MSDIPSIAKRYFLLYWAGMFVVAFSIASILMTIAGLLIDLLQPGCWYPVISPLAGISEPSPGVEMPHYCAAPVAAVIKFVFRLFAELVFVGVGGYMMLNGRKR